MSMPSFQHIAPPLRLYQGADCLVQLGRELDRLKCSRAVIFCGSTLAREGSPLALVREALGARCAGVFAGVRAHSPVPSVEAGARELQRLEADAVIAVGGGSAIVTARASSILLAEKNDAQNLCTTMDDKGQLKSPKLLAAKLPQLVVPTTPTTAAVKAGSAVLDPEAGRRLALFDPKTRAQAVFIHPDLLGSAPRSLIASASLDTFSLALEGLVSRTGDPLSDAMLMHALRLLARHLRNAATLDDAAVRGELAVSAVLCGQGTDFTGAGVTTVLGHAIGARFGFENGVSKAIVLPHALRFNAEAAKGSLGKVAAALGVAESGDGMVPGIVGVVEAMARALGVPQRLRDIGVARESLGELAANSMRDWFLRGNPRRVNGSAELQQLLEHAW